MNERAIRQPKGSAIIFLLTSFSYFSIILYSVLFPLLLDNIQQMPTTGIVRLLLYGITCLFMSIVLFSKKYNNLLIAATTGLLIPRVFTLFVNITPYIVSEIVFYLLLTVFTYVMVKMSESPIREKLVKYRFIIPAFQSALVLVSTIQLIQGVYEKYTATTGVFPEGAVTVVLTLLPSILSAFSGILPILCYVWLTNWLAAPYRK